MFENVSATDVTAEDGGPGKVSATEISAEHGGPG